MTQGASLGPKWNVLRKGTREAAGWLLVVGLFYSPWDDGGTSASAIRNLNWILASAFALWLVSLLQSKPSKIREAGYNWQVERWLLLAISAPLLLLGWGLTLNAHSIFDADYSVFLSLTSPLPQAPGSVDYSLSLATMRRVTVLIGTIWVVADLAQDSGWLLRLWWAIGLAGGSIALLGLVQKATGAQMILWDSLERGEPPVKTFFATYYYHGNAGAYLNLVLPAVLGLAFRYTRRRFNPFARALWLTLLLVLIVAVFSDTSRMGQFIAVLLMLTLLVMSAGQLLRRVRYVELKTALVALAVGALGLWAMTRESHLDQSMRRWEQLQESWMGDARWLVDEAATMSLAEAGAFGFGPGTFAVAFPYFNQLDERAQGSWLFLHNDHLQTFMEWGWVSGALWELMFVGGLVVAILTLTDRSHERLIARRRTLLALSIVALAGVGIHALVDFPLQISSIQLYAALYLGLCWGSRRWGQEANLPVQSISAD